MHRGAQVDIGEGELRDGRGHAAREARHGEEEVWRPEEGRQGQPGSTPTPAPTLATLPTASSGPTPTSAVQADNRIDKGVWADGLGHSPRLQLLVQVLLNQPQVFSPERPAPVELVNQALGVYREDTSLCEASRAGPSPAILPPGPPRGLTGKAHGVKQFLKLLELPWGEEQVQGAQLSGHLQLGADGAAMEPKPTTHRPSS